MLRSVCGISAAVLVTVGHAGCAPAAAQDPPAAAASASSGCSNPVALDLTQPRPAFELTTRDGRTVPAIVDTGATNTTVNIEFAAAVGLRNEGPLKPPFDRHSEGFQSTLAGASIGSLKLPDHSVSVMPSPLPDKAVILSPAAFTGKLVQFDFQAGTMKVCDRNWNGRPKGEGFAYTAGRFVLPAIPVTFGGRAVDALLDTGSPFTLSFPTALAKDFTLTEPLKKVGEAGTHGGARTPIYAAKVDGSVQVGPLKLEDPQVFFTDLASGANIGSRLIKQMVVTLDPEAKRSWVQAAEAK